jgi:hypothetical protein
MIKCYAHVNRTKIAIAFLVPFVVIAIYLFVFNYMGYRLSDTPRLIDEGKIHVVPQVLAFIGLIIWCIRYWPGGYRALWIDNCAIAREDSNFYAFGYITPLSDVASAKIQDRFLLKHFQILLINGDSISFPVLFIKEGAPAVVGEINELLVFK